MHVHACVRAACVASYADSPRHPRRRHPSSSTPPLDTIRTVEGYADCIVLRHFQEGSAARAASAASIPILNAGDGPGQHPSQVRGARSMRSAWACV
jgi:hypothetical protein